MSSGEKPVRKGKIIRKFFVTLLITFSIFLLAFTVVVVGLNMFGIENPTANFILDEINQFTGINTILSSAEENTIFLILGTDDGGTRTDTMILGCFNPKTESIDLISLPRDTKITLSEENVNLLKQAGRTVPSSGVMKLTELHHYAGEELGVEYVEKHLKELLNVDIDFYVKIDLSAFGYLVDEIGGVEFDVPQRMYYNDPFQDLLINLNPGVQTLTGKEAEGLVRFRSYPQGDIKRMEVQQAFIKAFIKQCMNKENLVNNASAMISTGLKYVKTDFNMAKLPGYVKHVKDFKLENINTVTLPISGTVYIDGKSYVIIDEDASREVIDGIFNNAKAIVYEESTEKLIQVLNGGNTAGLAKLGKEKIEENGLSVSSIGDYTGTKENHVRIFVNSRTLGKDIQGIFQDSIIVFDPNLDKNYDIVVVIGKNGIN